MADPFQDAVLYDWEYRRRRDDVRFYQTLADERGGPILDLGCGTGRLMLPLLRTGHTVVGIDGAPAMLARAAVRLSRLRAQVRRRGLLVRGDLRDLGFRPRFGFAVAAFHVVQHLETDDELIRFFRGAAGALVPGGWLAFDTFAPSQQFLARTGRPRGGRERWAKTSFRHPGTGRRTIYSESYRLDGAVLETTFHYQATGQRETRAVLRHRLLAPVQLPALLARAGLALIATWGGFDGQPLETRAAKAASPPQPIAGGSVPSGTSQRSCDAGRSLSPSQGSELDHPEHSVTEQHIFLTRRETSIH